MTTVPIVFIIFRRPETTQRVFDAIARVKPGPLLIVADGPRDDRPGEADACAATRAVVERIDWDCAVLRNYADVNLGCGQRPATGITWAFEHVDEAVILEDDCLPDPTFFQFAEEILERYRDDERVMHVAGSSMNRTPPDAHSYFFSRWGGAWGWATWRRAWQTHDIAVRAWPDLQPTGIVESVLEDPRAARAWSAYYEEAYRRNGQVSYWDYQWGLAQWANSGLSVVPRMNLVTNIGCGPDATHTLDPNDPLGNVVAQKMAFPLNHPPRVMAHADADRKLLHDVIFPRSIVKRMNARARMYGRLSDMSPDFLKRAYRAMRGRPNNDVLRSRSVRAEFAGE